MRGVRPDLRAATVGDTCKAPALELDSLVDLKRCDCGFYEPLHLGAVRHHEPRGDPVVDPLDLRDVLVRHGHEPRALVEDAVAEVLECHLLALAPVDAL